MFPRQQQAYAPTWDFWSILDGENRKPKCFFGWIAPCVVCCQWPQSSYWLGPYKPLSLFLSAVSCASIAEGDKIININNKVMFSFRPTKHRVHSVFGWLWVLWCLETMAFWFRAHIFCTPLSCPRLSCTPLSCPRLSHTLEGGEKTLTGWTRSGFCRSY